jgi:hypothetical protein
METTIYNNMEIEKNIVVKTEENTILIINCQITKGYNRTPYVSITADEISPLSYKNAVKLNREILEDNEYLWEEAVSNHQTKLGFEDWKEMIINIDGEIAMIDNSLYDEEIEINGEDYIFESFGCGCMHEEILKYYPSLKKLIECHLKPHFSGGFNDLVKAHFIIKHKIKDQDVDKRVLEITKEIIN